MSHSLMKSREIHSGVLYKVGGRVKSWNRRWMILSQDFTLKYFKEPTKAALGSISLHDPVFEVRPGDKTDTTWSKLCTGMDCTLVIKTTPRTYYMFAESKEDADMWILVLNETLAELKLKSGVSASIPSRYTNKTKSSPMEEFGAPTAIDSKYTPNVYKKKDRRLPTKRFATADEDDGDDDEVGVGTVNEVTKTGEILREDPPQNGDLTVSIQPLALHVAQTNNNNNGSTGLGELQYEAVSPMHVPVGSVDVHESLYDLVGRINAGSDDETKEGLPKSDRASGENHDTSINTEEGDEEYLDVSNNLASQQQDLYEEVDENPVVKSMPSSSSPPNNKAPQREVANGGKAPPKLQNQMSEMYEVIDSTPGQQGFEGFLYEELDDTANPNRIPDADSSDEDETPPTLPARNVPPDEYYGNAPPLPPKNVSMNGSTSNLLSSPLRVASPKVGASPNVTTTTEPTEPDEVYDDVFAVRPKEQNGLQEGRAGSSTSLSLSHQATLGSPVPKPRSRRNTNQSEDSNKALDNEGSEDIYDNGTIIMSEGGSHQPKQVSYPHYPKPLPRPRPSHKNSSSDSPPTAQETNHDRGSSDNRLPPKADCKSPTAKDKRQTFSVSSVSSNSPEIHSISDTGIEMFRRRSMIEENSITTVVAELLNKDSQLSSVDKNMLAEVLRQVEIEKQKATEERFKFERERLQYEEQRRALQEERSQLLNAHKNKEN